MRLSMKKLTNLAHDFLEDIGATNNPATIATILHFLDYIWKHRKDDRKITTKKS